ncbi:hypothetical protein [Streptomyces asiaticus]|uniref:hypothetical protein n=1 Tax=Streptomyces asiaticus TaxID=114695 RepID=UPI003D73CA25
MESRTNSLPLSRTEHKDDHRKDEKKLVWVVKIECDHHLKEVRIDSDTGCGTGEGSGPRPAVNETRRTT